jgi:hypothetical protein
MRSMKKMQLFVGLCLFARFFNHIRNDINEREVIDSNLHRESSYKSTI